MPVSPYRRSPARTLREACHEETGTAGADCVPIVRWPNSANGNTAENGMQRLGQSSPNHSLGLGWAARCRPSERRFRWHQRCW